jgi:hexokinase
MALADAVQKVMEEFEYTDDQIRGAVKEFLSEMGESLTFFVPCSSQLTMPSDDGLKNDGAMMNQIPTYVTAVPNGTEQVRAIYMVS